MAYILDPSQNGIGLEPLIRLIEKYSEKGANILQNLTLNNIKVIREYSFSNNRRIDILIKTGKEFIIAIENKIFAMESENQTVDYAKHIYDEFPDYECVLLFLTPEGTKPLSADFIPIVYT